jgi:hypothetical protein
MKNTFKESKKSQSAGRLIPWRLNCVNRNGASKPRGFRSHPELAGPEVASPVTGIIAPTSPVKEEDKDEDEDEDEDEDIDKDNDKGQKTKDKDKDKDKRQKTKDKDKDKDKDQH